jgi:hypothetical protein
MAIVRAGAAEAPIPYCPNGHSLQSRDLVFAKIAEV